MYNQLCANPAISGKKKFEELMEIFKWLSFAGWITVFIVHILQVKNKSCNKYGEIISFISDRWRQDWANSSKEFLGKSL